MKRWYLFILLTALVLPAAEAQFDSNDTAEAVHLSAALDPDPVTAGGTAKLRVFYEIPEGYYQSLQEDLFFFRLLGPTGAEMGEISYPGGTEKEDVIKFYGTTVLTADVRFEKSFIPGDQELRILAGYQLCEEDGMCLFPVEVELELPVTVLPAEKAGSGAAILKFLLLAFLGGLLLNVMPCVLPVLSIKALSLVKQGGSDRKKILAGSLAYTAGIVSSLTALAAVVIALKLSGELVGWGFQFQNPVFVLVLISIVFVFALSLFDVFVINAPGLNAMTKASGRGGHLGSFFSGAFAVLLATPCSAPFLGTALGFAFSQAPVVILAIFITVGIGLSTPFLLLGIWPGFIKRIPKPGNWMNIFKEIMGFLLIGTALWLISVLYHQIGGRGVISVLVFLVVLAFAAWVYGRFGKLSFSKTKRSIALAVAVMIIVVGAVTVPDLEGTTVEGTAGEEAAMPEEWEEFSPALLEGYLSEGQPVFLAFGAKWCLTCTTNERTVLYTRDMIEDFKTAGVQLLHGDYTNKDKIIGRMLADHGKGGVPFYAFYPPWQPEPILLPEIISRQMIRDLMEEYL